MTDPRKKKPPEKVTEPTGPHKNQDDEHVYPDQDRHEPQQDHHEHGNLPKQPGRTGGT